MTNEEEDLVAGRGESWVSVGQSGTYFYHEYPPAFNIHILGWDKIF